MGGGGGGGGGSLKKSSKRKRERGEVENVYYLGAMIIAFL